MEFQDPMGVGCRSSSQEPELGGAWEKEGESEAGRE